MQLFFHGVGLKGANQDFPKTVFGDVAVDEIVAHVPIELREEVNTTLTAQFPSGFCNVWGVPDGAKSIIKNLSPNDVMLLIKTTGGAGEMPALCHVKSFWRQHMPELSNFLWGSNHFPYVFFFKTQSIDLTWFQFKQDVNYMPKFRPSGNVYRVREDRFVHFDGVEGYVNQILTSSYAITQSQPIEVEEDTPNTEYAEGERKAKEVHYFKRNPKLVAEAKEKLGYVCYACGFDFEKVYGDIGKNYIECHHLNPLSERDDAFASTIDDVCMLCSNCHRMIHRSKPAIDIVEFKKIINSHFINHTDLWP
ncbi:hypothetical protein TUM4644_37390 [Shewanella colwelliana]|uniref:HNH endonuclease n=1 Tax=Shewanella colwelliana TaxID=23 RepID=UPI001BB86B98|nr:HNH endonuclease [Shewanella colwelliana]GIU36432.1 hypothetical protein TUM4644_37390 [Shewanella colwelliana]